MRIVLDDRARELINLMREAMLEEQQEAKAEDTPKPKAPLSELTAMARVSRLLEQLDVAARARVIDWAYQKYGPGQMIPSGGLS